MKKSFTLVELLVVVIVCGILATIALPAYQNFMENSKAKVCYTNQLTILKAVDIYTLETDKMPGTLSMLPAKYIQKAYAQIIPKASWDVKLAYWAVDREGLDMAYAQAPGVNDPWIGKFITDTKVLKCPLDNYYGSTTSYTIYPGGINYTAFKALTSTAQVIADRSFWHKRNGVNYAVGVNSKGDRLYEGISDAHFSIDTNP